jgi:hypothetical protein
MKTDPRSVSTTGPAILAITNENRLRPTPIKVPLRNESDVLASARKAERKKR